jgi:hypothetical protein
LKVSASLVLFNNEPDLFVAAMESFLKSCDGALHVVDNSSTPLRHSLFAHPRVRYCHPGRNLGFGAGHNLALRRISPESDLHLLLNPDIQFGPDVLPTMIERMRLEPDIGALMPRVQFPDGEPQRLCKLLPSPVDLIFRRFIPFGALRKRINFRYELHALDESRSWTVPTLSGCFLLIRMENLRRIGGFDERYFMYMEDVDLVRRIGDLSRTVFDPSAVVTHVYAKGSYREPRLLGYHMRSAVTYFNKWGWLYDPVRRARNRAMLVDIGSVRPKCS